MASVCMLAYTFYKSDPRVRREAEALVARGDTVDFICLQDKTTEHRQVYNGVQLYPLSAGRYQGDSTLIYLWKYASFFIRSFFVLSWLFFRKRYQVIQVHTMPDFLVFAAVIPKLFGAKIILDVHDLMAELYICKFKLRADHWLIRLITFVERRSIAFAHRAIAVHVPHREALVSHGTPREKFAVVLNVPDPKIFQPVDAATRTDNKFRLIYHGTVARRHGLEIALRAIKPIAPQIPNLELLVIGAGDDFDRIKALAEELQLGHIVRFLGRMPVDELPKYLRQSDVGLVPILYDDFTRYMLPLKLMEYAGMNIPSIVSRTETIEAYFDDSMVRYVTPGDAGELGLAILELYLSPEKRSQLVTNAGRFNQQYNWHEHKLTYYALVDSLLGKKAQVEQLEATT